MKSEPSDSHQEEDRLETIRSLLFAKEQERLIRLGEEIKELQKNTDLKDEELFNLLKELRNQHEDTQALIERITPSMAGMVRTSIQDSGPEIAEILGPIMGEAMRVQIRDSRDEMVDALYPVIGATIQKAISQFARDFQQNIDSRLKNSTSGLEGMLRRLFARLRGVSASELAMREALPFEIKEIFLIHRTSGMLIAHSHPVGVESADADLISSMLTAIRSFAQDAFQETEELDEIQFGNDRISIQGGAHAYLAVVLKGTKPDNFHTILAEFVANIHVRHNSALRDFTGDPETLPNFQPQLAEMFSLVSGGKKTKKLSTKKKKNNFIISVAILLLLVLACFHLVFVIKLFPVAFSQPTLTATSTSTPLPTATPSPLPTFTPNASMTPTFTPLPSPTATPLVFGTATGNLWVREAKGAGSPKTAFLLVGDQVNILKVEDDWLYISWENADGVQTGWVNALWIAIE